MLSSVFGFNFEKLIKINKEYNVAAISNKFYEVRYGTLLKMHLLFSGLDDLRTTKWQRAEAEVILGLAVGESKLLE